MDEQKFQIELTVWHQALVVRGAYTNSEHLTVRTEFMRELIKRAAVVQGSQDKPEILDTEWQDTLNTERWNPPLG